jgi:hypothetical protein
VLDPPEVGDFLEAIRLVLAPNGMSPGPARASTFAFRLGCFSWGCACWGRSEQEIESGDFSRLNRWISLAGEGVTGYRLESGAVSENGNPRTPVLDGQVAVEAPVPALRALDVR